MYGLNLQNYGTICQVFPWWAKPRHAAAHFWVIESHIETQKKSNPLSPKWSELNSLKSHTNAERKKNAVIDVLHLYRLHETSDEQRAWWNEEHRH